MRLALILAAFMALMAAVYTSGWVDQVAAVPLLLLMSALLWLAAE